MSPQPCSTQKPSYADIVQWNPQFRALFPILLITSPKIPLVSVINPTGSFICVARKEEIISNSSYRVLLKMLIRIKSLHISQKEMSLHITQLFSKASKQNQSSQKFVSPRLLVQLYSKKASGRNSFFGNKNPKKTKGGG